MENIVTKEFERQNEELRKQLRQQFDFPEHQLNGIIGVLEKSVFEMINLMKTGKSAHEKFFSDIILKSPDAIIGLDREFKIFLWNKGAENIFGYTSDETTGKDFSILIPEELIKKGERDYILSQVEMNGFIANHETERLTKSGKIINVSVTRFAVFDESNNRIGSVGIIRDITLIRSLQKAMREKENLALIGEVVSSIAHSLSNPLNIISGNADYLLLDKKQGDNEYEELKTIIEETTRITKSIRHLLNFSRPFVMEKSRTDINELVYKVLSDSKYILEHKKISFKKELQTDLPEIEIDKSQIMELLSNLITNSIQAISAEGKIKIKTRQEDKSIVIEVTDNGSGIPKENLDKIFSPFFSLKGYGKGTGLGLSIAKRIVNEHKGEISVESHLGKGTTFEIKLPVD